MSDRTFEDRIKNAEFRAMVEAYRQRHKDDASKEPAPETDLQRMARYMGVKPGDGNVSRRHDPEEEMNRRIIGIDL